MRKILDGIKNVLSGIVESIKNNKMLTILFIGVIAILLLIMGFRIYLGVRKYNEEKSPIVEIEATCDHEFKTSVKLDENLDYFSFKGIRENGKKSKLDTSKITLSQEFVNPYGEVTPIEVTYVDDEGEVFKCKVDVPNSRNKIIGFQCGYPTAKNVIAVLYSNGELCFEGEGDTLVFYEGEYPWLTEWWEELEMEEESVPKIKAITFEKGVNPTNLNYAFEGCEALIYVDKIPSSVRTMVKTFAGCTSLKNAADVTDATVLLNMNGTYEGCTELINSNIIPENVRIAKRTFKDCTELQLCADMTNANKLVIIDNMYENCSKLTSVTLREGITSMRGTFKECINLKQVANFPSTIKYMSETFYGAVSLSKFEAIIPNSVIDLDNCFTNCEILAGEVYIDSNTEKFNDIFLGACQATKINLLGDSMLLDAYANTNDTDNVYVNGVKPNPSILKYEDIFEKN